MAELLNEREERDGVRARSRPRHYAVGDCQVGIAGTKGFVGGFRGLGWVAGLRGVIAAGGLRRDHFWVFELTSADRAQGAIH
jgi:hypothetical protein